MSGEDSLSNDGLMEELATMKVALARTRGTSAHGREPQAKSHELATQMALDRKEMDQLEQGGGCSQLCAFDK